MPILKLLYDNLINLERDKDFLIEILSSNLGHTIVHEFIDYLKEESKSVVDYKDIILSMSYDLIEKGHSKNKGIRGVENEIAKLIIGLYDETCSSQIPEKKSIANECLDIWDLMYEKQIGQIRLLSQELMDR